MKRFRLGKSSALKAATKEAESELDVTSIMLAREQVTSQRMGGKMDTNDGGLWRGNSYHFP